MKYMDLPTNIRVASWLGSECIRTFMEQQKISDVRLQKFSQHISALPYAENVPEWDQEANELEITGMGDPLPEELSQIQNLNVLVVMVREISASQIFGAYKPQEVISYLKEAIKLSGLDPMKYNLERMNVISTGPEGFGVALSQQAVREFKRECI